MTGLALGQSVRLTRVLREAADGDHEAFAELVQAFTPDMLRVATGICGDGFLAHDAVQEAWGKAWRKLEGVKNPQRIRVWLLAIAANEARGIRRKQRRRRLFEFGRSGEEHAIYDPGIRSDEFRRRELHADLVKALSKLSEVDRVLVSMRYVAGVHAADMAPALGMSASGVRSRLARARATLRKELSYD
jgi:RNA polymerase sigma-70 factor (ECF subfamily)